MDFLLHGLAYQPISQQLCCTNKPNCNTLLLYGSGSTAGGTGKTSLAHALCNTLGKHPILAHVSVIECVSLRGKGFWLYRIFSQILVTTEHCDVCNNAVRRCSNKVLKRYQKQERRARGVGGGEGWKVVDSFEGGGVPHALNI